MNVATGRAEHDPLDDRAVVRAGWGRARCPGDPALIRADDPPEIRGDASLLAELTGWRPEIPLERTLADILAEAQADVSARP